MLPAQTVYYQLQRYHAAVVDCRVTLQFNPFHFAAASGMGMCCSAVGDAKGAVAAFEHAVRRRGAAVWLQACPR
jgi:hypothetical protein